MRSTSACGPSAPERNRCRSALPTCRAAARAVSRSRDSGDCYSRRAHLELGGRDLCVRQPLERLGVDSGQRAGGRHARQEAERVVVRDLVRHCAREEQHRWTSGVGTSETGRRHEGAPCWTSSNSVCGFWACSRTSASGQKTASRAEVRAEGSGTERAQLMARRCWPRTVAVVACAGRRGATGGRASATALLLARGDSSSRQRPGLPRAKRRGTTRTSLAGLACAGHLLRGGDNEETGVGRSGAGTEGRRAVGRDAGRWKAEAGRNRSAIASRGDNP